MEEVAGPVLAASCKRISVRLKTYHSLATSLIHLTMATVGMVVDFITEEGLRATPLYFGRSHGIPLAAFHQ